MKTLDEPSAQKMPVQGQAPASDEYSDADSTIQAECERQWRDDYALRNHCIEQQEGALAELRRGRPADIPDDIFRTIRTKCATQWPKDFSLRHYCEEEQFKAYRKLQARHDTR